MANEKRLIDANEFWNRLQNVVYDIFTAHEKDGQLTGTASVGYYTTTIEEVLKRTKTADAVEVVHAYWTGLIPGDYTFAEGFKNGMTPEERAKGHEDFIHTTHCSNCNGGFDDRWIRRWKYCPYCGAKMDGGNEDG